MAELVAEVEGVIGPHARERPVHLDRRVAQALVPHVRVRGSHRLDELVEVVHFHDRVSLPDDRGGQLRFRMEDGPNHRAVAGAHPIETPGDDAEDGGAFVQRLGPCGTRERQGDQCGNHAERSGHGVQNGKG